MNEKTVEELKAELKAVRKENLERELEAEKKIADDAKALEIKEEKDNERETMREEILAELGDKSNVQTTVEKTPSTNVDPAQVANLAGRHNKDLNVLKRMTTDIRSSDSKYVENPVDITKADAYREPTDDMDYYSRVRWLKAGGKKKQLHERIRANRVPGVI